MPSDPTEAWQVRDTDFPTNGSAADKLAFATRYAVLAPSSHNSQPWLFVLRGDRLDLVLDPTRALPVIDPDNRELTISCGAALFNLRIALRFFGYEPQVDRFPNPGEPELAASIRLGVPASRNAPTGALFGAIPGRHTHRAQFSEREVPPDLVKAMQVAAEREGGWLLVLDGTQRDQVAELIMEADRIQSDDPRFRAEVASWMHANRARTRDGMPGAVLGLGSLESRLAPFLVRTFDRGDGQAARDHQLSLGSPLMVVLGTQHDGPLPWLRAGEALEHVLLLAQSEGITASFLNQPIELINPRKRLASIIDVVDRPQLVLRMGHGTGGISTPRRSVAEVLLTEQLR